MIGIVPEGSSVFPELTAMGNMLFTGALYGLARGARKERAGELMSLLGLNDHQNKRAIDLSLGLKRRLTIAMSLMHSPQVVFLDEPTSGLDVESSRLVHNLLITLQRAGVTVFITTHNMEEANQLCHRSAIMNKGRLIAIDPPEQLKRSAADAVTVEVGFHRALSSAEMQELATAQGVTNPREVGSTYRLLTSKPPSVLEALYPFMKKHCLTPLVMNTRGPSLEEVFLRLTSERNAGE
jgi:ABC-2 type transport system ATP-binding protein